jgi:hypothetical protein
MARAALAAATKLARARVGDAAAVSVPAVHSWQSDLANLIVERGRFRLQTSGFIVGVRFSVPATRSSSVRTWRRGNDTLGLQHAARPIRDLGLRCLELPRQRGTSQLRDGTCSRPISPYFRRGAGIQPPSPRLLHKGPASSPGGGAVSFPLDAGPFLFGVTQPPARRCIFLVFRGSRCWS